MRERDTDGTGQRYGARKPCGFGAAGATTGCGVRVLLINDYGTPNGGAELQMLAIRDHLRARGHAVRLLASNASYVDGYVNEADRIAPGRTDLGIVLQQTVNVGAARAVRRELQEFPPDVVHIRIFLWQLSPLILPLLKNVPVLYQAAVYKAICPTGLKLLPDGTACSVSPGLVCYRLGCTAPTTWASTRLQLALLKRWRRYIDHTSVLSSRMKTMFEQEGWRDVEVIGNGIDLLPPRPPLGPSPVVAYAGRLAREKGVGTLIDAFAIVLDDIPDATLLIAGAGVDEPALRARAAPLGERVTFLGHLSRAAMERAFHAAWIQAVPSLWHEPFGNVSTEAMSRGTAVIASDVGGQSDIVRDGQTGFLVPPGDVAAWADRLHRVLADRELAEALGAKGREIAETVYARGPVIDRIERAYQTAIDNHRAGRRLERADPASAATVPHEGDRP